LLFSSLRGQTFRVLCRQFPDVSYSFNPCRSLSVLPSVSRILYSSLLRTHYLHLSLSPSLSHTHMHTRRTVHTHSNCQYSSSFLWCRVGGDNDADSHEDDDTIADDELAAGRTFAPDDVTIDSFAPKVCVCVCVCVTRDVVRVNLVDFADGPFSFAKLMCCSWNL